LVALVGEPGIGKTRLVEEGGIYARQRGAHVWWGIAMRARRHRHIHLSSR
jgi:hypothetical protein